MTESGKIPRPLAVLAALLLLAAVFLFSFFGITRSLRHDECCSVEISNTTLSAIVANLKANAHTPLIYCLLPSSLLKFWGDSEPALNVFSAELVYADY